MKRLQADLFDRETFVEHFMHASPPDEVAQCLRDDGIKRAADHADSANPTWGQRAFAAFKSFAMTHLVFTTEEVRLDAELHGLPDPPDKRAWGSVAARAARQGFVIRHGHEKASSPKVHCMYVTRWRSRCYTGKSA